MQYVKDWPYSNYPISIAIMLLSATTVALILNDDARAGFFGIQAYNFLIIGAAIRFLELAFSEKINDTFAQTKMHISEDINQQNLKSIGGDLRRSVAIIFHDVYRGNYTLNKIEIKKFRALISYISKIITIFLSAFLFIYLIYGLFIDWRFVEKDVYNLGLIILVFLTMHLFTRMD